MYVRIRMSEIDEVMRCVSEANKKGFGTRVIQGNKRANTGMYLDVHEDVRERS